MNIHLIHVNCSRLLSWAEYTVPHLTKYMRRMAADGYGEEYCRGVLKAALARYNQKVAADESGEGPGGYQREEWHKAKKAKRKYWATRGGATWSP